MSFWSHVDDPWKTATGWTTWSYYLAIAKDDEEALFWSTVYGGASVGTFIGTYLAAGGYAATGGWAGKAFLARFSPIGMLLSSTQFQYEIGQATDSSTETTLKFVRAGDVSSGRS